MESQKRTARIRKERLFVCVCFSDITLQCCGTERERSADDTPEVLLVATIPNDSCSRLRALFRRSSGETNKMAKPWGKYR